MVDIILRSELNGISPTRSKRRCAPVVDAELALSHQKRGFGGIALDLPGAVLGLPQVGIAGQAAAAQDDDLLGAKRPAPSSAALELHAAQRAHSRRR